MPGVERNRPINTDLQKNIITAMIVDTEFLRRIRPVYKSHMFDVEYLKKLSRWITTYFDQYEEAPNTEIQPLLEIKREGLEDKDYNLLKAFVENLNERYVNGEYNKEYLFKNTMKYFRKQNWKYFHQSMASHIQSGNLKKLTQLHNEFRDIEDDIKTARTVNYKGIKELLQTDTVQRIICMPGVLGDLAGWWERGWLVGIMGSFKRGKSFWLQFIAHICWEAGLNVAFVSLEMSERTMMKRINRYICKEPEPEEQTIYRGIRSYTRTFGDRMRMFVYPCFSASMEMIYNDIRREEHFSNWEADVLIIDHADIVLHAGKSIREGMDDIWKGMKRLAEERNWLVVTASQTNRAAITKEILDQMDTAEHIGKIAHSDCMIGLNQTQNEREEGIMRINVISHRHNEFYTNKAVVVEQDLAISRPCIRSYWESESR